MAKKDQNSDHHPHQGVLDHRRDFYGYSAGLPHGFEQYYSADFQAQVISFAIYLNIKMTSWIQVKAYNTILRLLPQLLLLDRIIFQFLQLVQEIHIPHIIIFTRYLYMQFITCIY